MKKYLIIIGPFVILLFWFLLSSFKLIKPIFLPSPIEVMASLIDLTIRGKIFIDLFPTVYRWLFGLMIGMVIGIPLGLIMGYSDKIYKILEVPMDFFRSIPVMTLFPLFLVFFGLGDKSKIAVSAWSALLFILINTIYGVRHSRELRLIVAKTLKATKIKTLSKIIFPSALPEIFVGVRVALSLSLIVVVASEMIMGTKYGLGKKIFESALIYDMSIMYAYIIYAGLLGYFSNKLLVLSEHRFIHWANK